MTPSPSAWFKSSYSDANTNCVEATHLPEQTALRDSRHPEQAVLAFSPQEWRAFLTQIKHRSL